MKHISNAPIKMAAMVAFLVVTLLAGGSTAAMTTQMKEANSAGITFRVARIPQKTLKVRHPTNGQGSTSSETNSLCVVKFTLVSNLFAQPDDAVPDATPSETAAIAPNILLVIEGQILDLGSGQITPFKAPTPEELTKQEPPTLHHWLFRLVTSAIHDLWVTEDICDLTTVEGKQGQVLQGTFVTLVQIDNVSAQRATLTLNNGFALTNSIETVFGATISAISFNQDETLATFIWSVDAQGIAIPTMIYQWFKDGSYSADWQSFLRNTIGINMQTFN